MNQKIGIYGGCFNPIHNGHLFLAENVKNNLMLDKIIFVPTGNPPHKKNIKTGKIARFDMAVLATENNTFFEVSYFEINKKEKSYTIDTVKYLRQKYKDADLFLIIGSDEFLEIEKWNGYKELFSLCSLIVALRPCDTKKNIYDYLRSFRDKYSVKIFVLDLDALNISSTQIRNRLAISKSVSNLVPERVEKYIREKNLYKPESDINISAIKDYLVKNLSFERFTHSISVADEAVKLSEHYGADIAKAYVAGLLHDCTKEIDDQEKIRLCKKYNITLDDYTLKNPGLAHQFLSSKIAEIFFDINDSDILNAISYHTTARKNMSLLEKIVYLADRTESNRSFDGVDYLRKIAYRDLNQTIKFVLQTRIKDHGDDTHPLSSEAFEFYNLLN